MHVGHHSSLSQCDQVGGTHQTDWPRLALVQKGLPPAPRRGSPPAWARMDL